MTIDNRRLTRHITVRYYLALVLMGLVVTASYFAQSRGISAERAHLRVIDFVKDQRGDIEAAAGVASLLAVDADHSKHSEYRKSLQTILSRIVRKRRILNLQDQASWVPSGMRMILHKAYDSGSSDIGGQITAFLALADELLKPDLPDREAYIGAAERLEAMTPGILGGEDELIRLLRAETHAGLERLHRLTTVLWLSTLAILAVEVPLIFRPMRRKAAATLEYLEDARQRAEEDAAAAEAAREGQASFIRNMSHELRTPLNGILGMAQLLRMRSLPSKEDEYVGDIQSAGEGLLQLINSILQFSRLEAGEVSVQLESCNLREVLERAVSLLQPLAEKNSLAMTCCWDSGLADYYRADGVAIRQVLLNLIGNAIKFTHEGSVIVRALHRGSAGPHADYVRFEVEDTGIGVEHEKQESIFQEFQQAENGLARRYGGTGLGLAICRRLVDLMGGELGLNSVRGDGSTFWVTLTLQKVPVPEA